MSRAPTVPTLIPEKDKLRHRIGSFVPGFRIGIDTDAHNTTLDDFSAQGLFHGNKQGLACDNGQSVNCHRVDGDTAQSFSGQTFPKVQLTLFVLFYKFYFPITSKGYSFENFISDYRNICK